MASKSAEFKAGVVVLLGLVVLAVGLYLVGGGADRFRDKKRIFVYFRNGGGIGKGDAVFLAGRRVGKVVSVSELDTSFGGKTGTFVVVEAAILKQAKVHTDSYVSVSKTVTGIVTLNIDYGASTELAPEGAKLKGEKLATFEEAIDKGEKLLDGAHRMIADVDKLIVGLEKSLEEFDMAGLGKKAQALLDDLTESATTMRGILDRTAPEVDAILARAKSGAGDFEQLAGGANRDWVEMSRTLKATLASAERAAAQLEAILDENRPAIRKAVQNLADGSLRVAPVLAKIENLVQASEALLIDIRPKLSSGLRAASIALKNFQGVTEDLKTAPWKLINAPSDEENREVHLYNAARQFVDGAERIQEVVDELDALRREGGLGDERLKKKVEELTARLEQSLRDYGKHEKALVGLLERLKDGKRGG